MSSLVSALRSKLASRADYERLIAYTNLKEVLDFFQDRYGLLVIYRQPGDELQLQRSITSNYYRVAKLVRSFSTPGLRKVINAILEKEDLELLASILKAIAEGAEPETISSQLVPAGGYDEDRIKKLAETRSVRRAAESLEDRELRESILAAISEPGIDTKAAVDLSIQGVYAKRLWRTVKTFLTGLHTESAQRILGQRLDLQNILLVVRSRSLGVSSKVIQSFLLPVHYRLQQSTIEEMAGLSSLTDIFRHISTTSYQRAMASYEQISRSELEISSLETSFNRYLADQCFRAFAGWRFSAGLVVAFLFLKLFETNDLKAILTGKVKSIPPSLIWRDIVLHPQLAGQR